MRSGIALRNRAQVVDFALRKAKDKAERERIKELQHNAFVYQNGSSALIALLGRHLDDRAADPFGWHSLMLHKICVPTWNTADSLLALTPDRSKPKTLVSNTLPPHHPTSTMPSSADGDVRMEEFDYDDFGSNEGKSLEQQLAAEFARQIADDQDAEELASIMHLARLRSQRPPMTKAVPMPLNVNGLHPAIRESQPPTELRDIQSSEQQPSQLSASVRATPRSSVILPIRRPERAKEHRVVHGPSPQNPLFDQTLTFDVAVNHLSNGLRAADERISRWAHETPVDRFREIAKKNGNTSPRQTCQDLRYIEEFLTCGCEGLDLSRFPTDFFRLCDHLLPNLVSKLNLLAGYAGCWWLRESGACTLLRIQRLVANLQVQCSVEKEQIFRAEESHQINLLLLRLPPNKTSR